MVDFDYETPPVSPLRLERNRHGLTCLTSKTARTGRPGLDFCDDWTRVFHNFGAELKDNVDLRKKVDFDLFDSHGWTGLHAAVIMNDVDLVKVTHTPSWH